MLAAATFHVPWWLWLLVAVGLVISVVERRRAAPVLPSALAAGLLAMPGAGLAGSAGHSPAQVFAALKAHPIPASALPPGFHFVDMKTKQTTNLLEVFELLRGPDTFDGIAYIIAPSASKARIGFPAAAAGATNVRISGGFPSPALLFDHVVTGAGAKTGCGAGAQTCAATTLAVRSGFVIVSCAAAIANAHTGNAGSAIALARFALAYLSAIER